MSEDFAADNLSLSDADLRQKLNRETAKISWHELQRAYAQGRLLWLSREMDLVETGLWFIRDRAASIQDCLEAGRIVKVTDEHAQRWLEANTLFWALVIAPWVLIQEP